MPYAAFQASHIYGNTVASMQATDAVGVLQSATPAQQLRPSLSTTGTGTAPTFRPYRGYAASFTGLGTGSLDWTPHKRLRFGITVNVGATPSADDIAQAIWNAQASAYNNLGSMGAKVNTASSGGVDLDALSQAVWDRLLTTMTVDGSAGAQLNKLLTTGKFIALKG